MNSYAIKLDKLKDIGRFLETYNIPRLNQEEIDNLNKTISGSKIEFVI